MPDGEAKEASLDAVGQVEDQEDEHLEWASSTWEKLVMTEAGAAWPRRAWTWPRRPSGR
jgi:hypothetical protein